MTFAIIVAADEAGGIGKNGELPWKLPGDLEFFRHSTTATSDPMKRNAVIMGRRTWETIPVRFRPLPARLNIVVSKNKAYDTASAAELASGLEVALTRASEASGIESLFVIGGGVIYEAALRHADCTTVLLTRVEGVHDCDAFFPPLDASFSLARSSPRQEENGVGYVFECWIRSP